MNYAPADLNLNAAEYGFTVGRTYEAIDHPGDVTLDAEGVWHIKAGSRVRVRLSLVAPARRYHVALTDPLPAGFESLNRYWRRPDVYLTTRPRYRASGNQSGSIIRIYEMNAPKHLHRCFGKVFTTIRTSPGPQRQDRSSCLRQKPKRCTIRKRLVAARRIACASSE
jgi:alpha-2-macroglobulin-like protein